MKPVIKLYFLFILLLLCSNTFSYSIDIDGQDDIDQNSYTIKEVNLLHKLFDAYFNNANDDEKKRNKAKAEKTQLNAIKISKQIGYEKGEYWAYRNLTLYYKYFNSHTNRLKYEFKYQQNKKRLNELQEEEKRKLEEQKRIEAIKQEKEAEIRKLEEDKDANRALIEAKKRELESANSLLTESISTIEENQEQITNILDSIQRQVLINEKLALENKILEDEKKFIALREAERARTIQFYTTLTILGSLLIIFMVVLVFSMRKNQKKLTEKNKLIEQEKARSDELLLNILPQEVAAELKEFGSAKAQSYNNATVFFSDFKDFTRISEKLSPAELVEELDFCFMVFDKIIEKYNIEKIKTVGDAYICASGLNHKNTNSPREILMAAIEIREFIKDRIEKRKKEGKEYFQIRIGVHTGPIVAGIVGFKKFAYDIWGDTVNTAARMEQHSETGMINVSLETYELVKSDFSFTYRGKIEAKNKGEIDMYFVNESV